MPILYPVTKNDVVNNLNSFLYFYFSLCYAELQLITDQPSNPCPTPNTTYDANCVSLYGTNTRFCKTGECRCISNSSFYANGKCGMLNIFE